MPILRFHPDTPPLASLACARLLAKDIDIATTAPNPQQVFLDDKEFSSDLSCSKILGATLYPENDEAEKWLSATVEDMNEHLKLRTFLVGHQVTLADIVCWARVRTTGVTLPHVKRWVDHLENLPPFVSAVNFRDGPVSTPASSSTKNTFLHRIIREDLQPGGRVHGTRIHTRFPPEPNGYLHIGHAKSICVNFGLAKEFNGTCNLRFDDTNPETEKTEYVESIKEDVTWICRALGYTGTPWGDNLFFASDYFETLFEYAVHLIHRGKAYVDSQTPEEIKENRGNVFTPGKNSPCRDRTVEDNLRLFTEMQAGKYEAGQHVLRATIDMCSPNMNMRDPIIYRILKKTHHRTGDKWNVYPMYDFAHGQGDAIEGITHSICTLEFENHRELYDWCTTNLPVPHIPRQHEFARLNLTNTVTSKRKLLVLVAKNVVSGWDDPRMPTLQGLRRRGVRAEALVKFCDEVGVTTSDSTIDFMVLEDAIRTDLEPICPRRFAVLQPLKVTITSYSGTDTVEAQGHPTNPDILPRQLTFSNTIYINADDYMEDASKDYFRLSAIGSEVKLRHSYVIKLAEVVKDENGTIRELQCTHDPETRDCLPQDRKVRGVIQWVNAVDCVDVDIHVFAHLSKEGVADDVEGEDAAAEADFMDRVNPHSLVIHHGKGEPALAHAATLDRFQFERAGFFAKDKDGHFNCIVGLRESADKKKLDPQSGQSRSRKEEQDRQKLEKERMKSISPAEMFKNEKYSEWDEDGVPTKDAAGTALPKTQIKKLRKEWEKQKKLFES